ncbi:response regulator, partial [Pseudomonas aeruginosa]
IKNNSTFKSTPVIMLSSNDALVDKSKGRFVGSAQYLTKPFSTEELLGAFNAHVPSFTPVDAVSLSLIHI